MLKTTSAVTLAMVTVSAPAMAQNATGTGIAAPESYTMKTDGRKSVAKQAPKSPQPAGDEMIKAAQQALKEKGHDPGSVDGRMGRRTQQALRDYQSAHGIPPTGELDLATLVSLGVEPARTTHSGASAAVGSASPTTGDDVSGDATQ